MLSAVNPLILVGQKGVVISGQIPAAFHATKAFGVKHRTDGPDFGSEGDILTANEAIIVSFGFVTRRMPILPVDDESRYAGFSGFGHNRLATVFAPGGEFFAVVLGAVQILLFVGL